MMLCSCSAAVIHCNEQGLLSAGVVGQLPLHRASLFLPWVLLAAGRPDVIADISKSQTCSLKIPAMIICMKSSLVHYHVNGVP